jgi:class 3 adenylate cyclase
MLANDVAFGAKRMHAQTAEDENIRLRAEVDRLREQEVASREILAVISQSREDERPVLDAITQNSVNLCDAVGAGLWLLNAAGDVFRLVSTAQQPDHIGETVVTPGLEFPRENDSLMGQCFRDSRSMNVPDIRDDPYYRDGDPSARKLMDKIGIRSRLIVPLLTNGVAFGCISLIRREVRAFSDAEITLIESFAAQAVIALENVRQFREVQTRLERETATKNILSVISQSRDDEVPVFDAILTNAARLCHAPIAGLVLVNKERKKYELVASRGAKPDFVAALKENPPDLDPERFAAARAIVENRVVHVEDLASPALYGAEEDHRITTIKTEGIRTALFVPLIWNEQSVGAIGLWRRKVKPFHADEIALVETFAVQAVIAIENVRQFKALEALNTDLSDRVDEQVGEIERMGRLKRFLPTAVADTVISRGADKMLSSHRALLGVLFCDIRGFTAFCETAEPEETIEVLQSYHEEMGRLINAHGAGVDHRMGDGIMVLFNDPLPCDDPAGEAVRLALAMRARMAELSNQWKRMGYKLGFGVGVSLGYATVGMVGFEGRSDYTASGTAINLASRLCDEAQDGEILLSPKAAIAIEDLFRVESRGELSLKGLREPLEIFRLIDCAAS